MRGEEREVDYLIVGQGLAGSLLARALLKRGRQILVVDQESPSAASRVAAGLVNPVTGQKLVKTWRADTLLPYSRKYYEAWEAELGEKLYSEKTIWRFFQSEREEEIWKAKRNDPTLAGYAAPLPKDFSLTGGLQPQRGGCQVTRGAHVAVARLLALFRRQLAAKRVLIDEAFAISDLQVKPDRIRWRGLTAKKILFCEGHAASRNPYFPWIPFRHAKGELLTVRGPALPEEVVLNGGKWLLPIARGLFCAGATYTWDDLSEKPTVAGREAILAGLRALVPWEPEIVTHQAGVRPIVQDTRPVAGLHPAHPAVGILNGLASKGVLWAPFFAEQLVEHLENGTPLDAAVDVRRNF